MIRTIGRRRAVAVCAVALALAVTASVNAATAARGTLTWAKLRPATTPSPRAGAAMAYDPGLGRIEMFGGYDQNGYLNTTWAWNGTTWKHVQIPPSQSPPPRAAAGMGYDATDKILIMYGGFDGQRWLRDTWAFDSFDRTWERLRPAHQPPPETGPMLFTDPINGLVDMFGGFDGQFFSNTTWQYTGSNWHRLRPAHSPGGRGSGVTALDPSTGEVLLFAGLGDVRTYDTWTWDGVDWTLQSPSQQPPFRFYSSADYDPALGGIVMFGGGSPDGDLADTWLWTGSDWTELFPAASPSARESAGLAFDVASSQLVLFGGQPSGDWSRQTWTLRP